MKFEMQVQNSMYFQVVMNTNVSTVYRYAISIHIYSGTSMGHPQWGCWHNSDAEQIFLFLRILWVDCDKNWHGTPVVIELKHREEKIELPWCEMAKKSVVLHSGQELRIFFKKSRLWRTKINLFFQWEFDCRVTLNFMGILPGYTWSKLTHLTKWFSRSSCP